MPSAFQQPDNLIAAHKGHVRHESAEPLQFPIAPNAKGPARRYPLRTFTARAAREAAASPKRKQARKGTIPLRALSARAARGTARKKNSALRERDALPSRSLALQYSRRRRA